MKKRLLSHRLPLLGIGLSILLTLAAATASPAQTLPDADAAPGATAVLKWKDGKAAALVLMFDDNLDSQQRNAVPELEKRQLKGVFYINPDKMGFRDKSFWQQELPKLGHEYAVHTMTHKVTDEKDAEWEIGECAAILRKVHPASPTSPLLSYGRPGGDGAFMVSDQVEAGLLEQNQLAFRGLKDLLIYLGQDVAFLDKWLDGVIKGGEVGKILFHGVGGDYLSVRMEVYNPFLDHVVDLREKLWVAGHMPIHKYATERQTAKVTVAKAGEDQIVLALSSQADPRLYDQPLTLKTRVPAVWKECVVTQGARRAVCKVNAGCAQYEAMPGAQVIKLARQ